MLPPGSADLMLFTQAGDVVDNSSVDVWGGVGSAPVLQVRTRYLATGSGPPALRELPARSTRVQRRGRERKNEVPRDGNGAALCHTFSLIY